MDAEEIDQNKQDRVTKKQVSEICDQLWSDGIEPSARKIRKILGKGSYETIQKYLDEWRKERDQTDVQKNPAPPEVLDKAEQFAAFVWGAADKTAQTELVAFRNQAQKTVTALQGELEEFIADLDEVHADLNRERETNSELTDKLTTFVEQNARLNGELDQVKEELDLARKHLVTERENSLELEQQNARLSERVEQLHHTTDGLQAKLDSQGNELDMMRASLTECEQAKMHQANLFHEKIKTAEGTASDLKTKLQTVEDSLASEKGNIQHWQTRAIAAEHQVLQQGGEIERLDRLIGKGAGQASNTGAE